MMWTVESLPHLKVLTNVADSEAPALLLPHPPAPGRSRTWLSTDQDREGGRCGTILIQQCPTVGLELVTRKGKKVSDLVEDSAT